MKVASLAPCPGSPLGCDVSPGCVQVYSGPKFSVSRPRGWASKNYPGLDKTLSFSGPIQLFVFMGFFEGHIYIYITGINELFIGIQWTLSMTYS